MLWTSFKKYFTTSEQVVQDFKKCLNWYKQRVSGNVLNIERTYARLHLWISFLTPPMEIVIPTSHQRYPNPQLKLQNWRLPILSKMVAIVGDSNLSRIEPFTHISCQVESYPGARIEHIAHLFTTYISSHAPRFLILSIGINDATNRQPHLQNNIGSILKHLPHQFNQTKVFFVELQVSPSQPPLVHDKAGQINRSVPVDMHLIPGLPCFETGRDNVHWTPQCANSLVLHWLNHIK